MVPFGVEIFYQVDDVVGEFETFLPNEEVFVGECGDFWHEGSFREKIGVEVLLR